MKKDDSIASPSLDFSSRESIPVPCPPTIPDHRDYYRLPWSLSDNGMSWLEITTRCNLACRGCYRDPRKDGHKPIEKIKEDLVLFQAMRRSDGMSVAGGDPLLHPDIVEIVRTIALMGWKPLINTNGLALSEELLKKLKTAGAASLTFHVDTTQDRKDCQAEKETDYEPLRRRLADMLARVGGITCGYNLTVSAKNIAQIPEVLSWAEDQADRVHSIHFILYRDPGMADHLKLYAAGKEVTWDTHFIDKELSGLPVLKTADLIEILKKSDPLYRPNSYLGGTADPTSMKWTLATRFVLGGKSLGYAGPRFMELSQYLSHLFKGRWLSISSPSQLAAGRIILFLFAFLDKGVGRSLLRYLLHILKNPFDIFAKVYLQSILILQTIDFMADGRLNMCDGCPDMTIHDGKLYWSCRLEEIKNYGDFVTAVPKSDGSSTHSEALSIDPVAV